MARLALLILALVSSGCGDDGRPDAGEDTSVTVDSSTRDSGGPDSSAGGPCGGATCGPGSSCCGPPECGFCAPDESGVFCGFTCDAGTGDAGGDGGGGDAGPTACDPESTVGCADGLGCECCGAVGPTPICICTTTCASSDECTDPARPFCNVEPGGTAGVCTTSTFMCCWGCE